MLLRFRVANHRSIRAEHELSFVASDVDEEIVRHTGTTANGREIGVLPAVGIFGANASGKSNVLSGLASMRIAVRDSLADWARGEGVPREPFALDEQAREETTLFEVDLLLGSERIRYTYGFELSDDHVEAEWLHAYPDGHKQVWFDREANRDDGEDFRFPNSNLRDARKLVDLTRPNALLLTVGASFNQPQLARIHRWFIDNVMPAPLDNTILPGAYTKHTLVDEKRGPGYHNRIESLMKVADLGVTGIDIDRTEAGLDQIRLLHQTSRDRSVPLSFQSQESLGTQAWFNILGYLLNALDGGRLLLIDELDSSLHPLIAAELIRLFHDHTTNPHGAQLLFTTHDATLLGSDMVQRPLGRDQVRMTTKRKTGETELYPLLDAQPRKNESLGRGYLRGRYGGVPRVTTGEITREVAKLMTESE